MHRLKINVLEKIKANKIIDAYYVLETDSIIKFKGKRYLMEFREFFNKNHFDKIAIWKPLGYLEFTNVELAKSKKFFEVYNIKPIIQALSNRLLYRLILEPSNKLFS